MHVVPPTPEPPAREVRAVPPTPVGAGVGATVVLAGVVAGTVVLTVVVNVVGAAGVL